MLHFAFSPIGNIYSIKEQLAILELMLENFEDDYNKSLYLFDSYSTKIFGTDTIYLSLHSNKSLMFFKIPIDSMIVEISNKPLVHTNHSNFASPSHAPKHIPKDILKIYIEYLANKQDMIHFSNSSRKIALCATFLSSIAKDMHHLLRHKPK